MTLNIIVYSKEAQNINKLNLLEDPLLKQLQDFAKVLIIPAHKIDEVDKNNLSILWLLNKEAPLLIKRDYEKLPRPILFLMDENKYNLSIVLEAVTWLNSNSIESEILYGNFEYIKNRIQNLGRILETGNELLNKRIGILDSPSTSLIASNVDYFLTKRRWGVSFIDIPIKMDLTPLYTENFKRIKVEIPDSIDFYSPLQQLLQTEKLDALALDLFKVPKKLQSSFVATYNKLVRNNIPIAYCTDPQALFTMLITHLLIDTIPTFTQPVNVNKPLNELVLMTHSTKFNNLDDSAIDTKFTLVKCGGLCLDQFHLATGTLTKGPVITEKQQTLLTLQMDSPVEKVLKKPLGSHYLLVQGDYSGIFHDFFTYYHCIKV